MLRQFVLSTIIAVSVGTCAGAGEITDLAAKAESQLQAGNGVDAVTTMRQALVEAWKASPMAIRKALFVTNAAGYGVYTPRPNETFAQGEPILIYLEPVGFLWKAEGELHSSLLVADFEIRSPAGEAQAGQKNFGQFEFRSHEQNAEYMATLTLNLTGAPMGSYVLVVLLRDRLGGESAEVQLPFNIQ